MAGGSRFLSFVLRHQPEEIGLTLDPQGWADVSELLAKMAKAGKPLTQAELFEIVDTNAKKRFTLSAD